MLLKEILYRIRQQIKEGFDDSKVTDDYLANLFNTKRAYYIRREYNQLQRTIDNNVKQTIVIPLIETEAEDCDCGIADEVMRTEVKVPFSIEIHDKNLITKVSTTDHLDAPFSFIDSERAPYVGSNTYTAPHVFAYLHDNGYVYVFRRDGNNDFKALEEITVTGVFDNPLQLESFTDPESGAKYFDHTVDQYPVKQWMIDFIIKEIVQDLVGLKQVPEDLTNNAADNNG